MTDIAISVRNVSKRYQVFDDQRSRLLHAVWPKHTKGMQEIWALKDIHFEIKRGEAVAIIGRNGGGKSTLLEILTGTLTPTTGEVKVNGRVSALLELGSGFNPEYSGRDNVILNGLLLGLSREDILSRFEEIEAFAEIGAAIDRPVKTYSSGMTMRLAFAVQVLCDPDILIIDEALSVGDFFFQQKCLSYIRGLCAKGVTLLFVSHDMGTVRDICNRAIYLLKGVIECDDESTVVIHRFLSGVNANKESSINSHRISKKYRLSESEELKRIFNSALWKSDDFETQARILAVAVFDDFYNPTTSFHVGDPIRLAIAFRINPDIDLHVSVALLNKFDQTVTVTGSYHLGCEFSEENLINGVAIFELRIVMNLEAGNYSLAVNLGRVISTNKGFAVHQLPSLGPINLSWDYDKDISSFLGMVGLPVSGTYVDPNSAKGFC